MIGRKKKDKTVGTRKYKDVEKKKTFQEIHRRDEEIFILLARKGKENLIRYLKRV